jgi:hypothetical protein
VNQVSTVGDYLQLQGPFFNNPFPQPNPMQPHQHFTVGLPFDPNPALTAALTRLAAALEIFNAVHADCAK